MGIELFSESDKTIFADVNRPVLLEASAGSGKTTILVERYFCTLLYRILSQNLLPEQASIAVGGIVAITFTKKAATEMKERIRSKIETVFSPEESAELEAYIALLKRINPNLQSGNLHLSNTELWQTELQKSLTGAENISTIHSFGLKLLKSHPVEAAYDPSSSIEDEEGIDSLTITKQDAFFFTMRELIDHGDESLSLLTRYFGYGCVEGWVESIVEMIGKTGFDRLEMRLKSEGYLGDKPVEFAEFAAGTKTLRDRIADAVRNHKQAVDKAGDARGHIKAVKGLEEAIGIVESDFEAEAFSGRLVYGGNTEHRNDEIREARIEIAKACDAYLLYSHRFLFPHLWSIAGRVEESFVQLKRERREIGFNDIERLLLRALESSPDLRREIGESFGYILIDEFQDTSDVQWNIFRHFIFGEKVSSFLVGDPKQSIYAFRNANVKVFTSVKELFLKRFGIESIRYLEYNFRSTAETVRNINAIFADVIPATGAEYRAQSVPPAKSEIETPDSGVFFIAREGDKAGDRFEQACRKTAKLIKSLVRSGVRAGEIMVLMRNKTRLATLQTIFAEQLKRIPYFTMDASDGAETFEVSQIVAYLRSLDDPTSDYRMTALLKSAFFRLNDAQIYILHNRASEIRFSLFQLLSAKMEIVREMGIESELEIFKNLLTRKNHLNAAELTEELIAETGYFAFLNGLPNRKEATGNVIAFRNLLRQVQLVKLFHLTELLYYFDRYGVKLAKPKIVGEYSDVVRVMTIHSAKGLESKIVFYIPNPANLNRLHGVCILQGDNEAIGLNLIAEDARYGKLKSEESLNNDAEERRLAYVALTRARERLYYVGNALEGDKSPGWIDSWHSYFAPYLSLQTQAFDCRTHYRLARKSDLKTASDSADKLRIERRARFLFEHPATVGGDAGLPKVVTITQLLDMEFSPDGFRNKYLLNAFPVEESLEEIGLLPEISLFEDSEDRSRADLGTFLHSVFQKADAADYKSVIERLLPDAEESVQRRSDHILKLADAFYASPFYSSFYTDARYSRQEWEMFYPFRGFFIKGVIDCYLVNSGGESFVIDYKLWIGSNTARYERQLNYYAMILKSLGIATDRLFLYDMEASCETEAPLDLVAAERSIGQSLDAIAQLYRDSADNAKSRR